MGVASPSRVARRTTACGGGRHLELSCAAGAEGQPGVDVAVPFSGCARATFQGVVFETFLRVPCHESSVGSPLAAGARVGMHCAGRRRAFGQQPDELHPGNADWDEHSRRQVSLPAAGGTGSRRCAGTRRDHSFRARQHRRHQFGPLERSPYCGRRAVVPRAWARDPDAMTPLRSGIGRRSESRP